ncbi:MAG: HDOD domain-containing protein [Gammaproteobacteria bacterium]|jgi:HD-like signal output (HDOD) protein
MGVNTSEANPRDIDYLRTLPVFARLAVWQVKAVADAAEPIEVKKGKTFLQQGSDDGFTYFVTEGDLRLRSAGGEQRELTVTPESSRNPVANLRPRMLEVTALSRVRGFRIPDMVISAAVGEPTAEAGAEPADAALAQLEADLGFRLYHDLRDNVAVLPTLPDLAMRIRRAVEDGGNDARDIARVIETDPAMAAKLLKVANSAFYSRRNRAETCAAAVVRLGTRTTQKLVLSFTMREVFQARQPQLKARMRELWKHSATVAAISFTLARSTGLDDPEEAMLAGLVHDVGSIAIINYSQNIPQLARDPAALERTIQRLRAELGALILREWSFAPPIVAAAREAENWVRESAQRADLADLVIVAQVHERLAHHGMEGLPPFDRITALKRVLGDDVTPETSLGIIKEAQDQIGEMRGVLGG